MQISHVIEPGRELDTSLHAVHVEPRDSLRALPASQTAQATCAVADWNLPGMQSMHDSDPFFGWYVPASHDAQKVAPLLAMYVPLAHTSQKPWPVAP